MTASTPSIRLVYSDGRPILKSDIRLVKARAEGPSPWGNNAWAYQGGAPRGRNVGTWLPAVRSPDSEINYARDLMVGRARDLVRNDPWARGAQQRLMDAAIGAHFFPVPKPNWRVLQHHCGPRYDRKWAHEFTTMALAEWRMWANDPGHWCDAARTQTVTQILYTNLLAKIVEGDCLAVLPWLKDRQGLGAARYATTVQTIDPDRLSNPFGNIDTRSLRGGVEVDALEAPIAYHIRQAHQNDVYCTAEQMTWTRWVREMPWGRSFVVHDFDKERATQHRGTSILVSVLPRLMGLANYDEYTLTQAMLRTVYGLFVTSPYDAGQVENALQSEYQPGMDWPTSMYQEVRAGHYGATGGVEVNGVKIGVLAPGEKVEEVGNASGTADNYETFQAAFLRSVASATGQSTEEISNDFSKLNYSSFRGAMLQSWKTLIRRRRNFSTGTCAPIYAAWLEEFCAKHPDLLPAGFTHDLFVEHRAGFAQSKWIGPGRGWVDPVKERQGEVLGLDAGFGTLEDTAAEIAGEYYLDVLDQRQSEVEAFKARGLKLPEVFQPTNATEDDRKPMAARSPHPGIFQSMGGRPGSAERPSVVPPIQAAAQPRVAENTPSTEIANKPKSAENVQQSKFRIFQPLRFFQRRSDWIEKVF